MLSNGAAQYSNDSGQASHYDLHEASTLGNGNSVSRKNTMTSNEGQPVRRRISRACDQCNQLRTKCDGKQPCAHCEEFGLTCEYARRRKKRGKASRKDIAAQRAAEARMDADAGQGYNGTNGREQPDTASDLSPQSGDASNHQRSHSAAHTSAERAGGQPFASSSNATMLDQSMSNGTGLSMESPSRIANVGASDRPAAVTMSDYGSMDDYHRSMLHPGANVAQSSFLHGGASTSPPSILPGTSVGSYGGGQFAAPSPNSQQGLSGHAFRTAGSPMSNGFLGQSPVANSPAWLSLPSPSAALYASHAPHVSTHALRYPVLAPVLPYIASLIPTGLACDLLELYFTSTSSVLMHPQSPYLLGYIFRKQSFLRQNSPRACSPALLASMLWVAAQTSDSAYLTSPPSARGRVCQKLLELTVGLLRPLIHTPTDGVAGYGANTVVNGVALGGLGVSLPGQAHDFESGSPGASGALDDVATYLHLATVVSASEYKAASLRWWNAAWSLARELKLGHELPYNPESGDAANPAADQANMNGEAAPAQANDPPTRFNRDEEREERRRIWWLLFCMDRHLSLCYNKPLFLLDIECTELLQPQSDLLWQAGEFYTEEHAEAQFLRGRGPPLECNGHSIFGYFLPLMTILGEIIELNQARNHPRFGVHFQHGVDWTGQINEIMQQLDGYGHSLKTFEINQGVPQIDTGSMSQGAVNTDGAAQGDKFPPAVLPTAADQSNHTMRESLLQTKIVVAYGTHLMHTLHILLNGKWDPISLLDDNDLWISSQSFVSATAHAVSASEALSEILDYDPDLSFMPFFFGIYLLQGSFLLLLIADKLGGEASHSVVKACETIVRAHEACVVTLNTEYQRNFRKVMRSALAQVRGRLIEDFGESQQRRREVLALYRWTGDGTGLAL